MSAETAAAYRVRLVVQRKTDMLEARWIEANGRERPKFRLNLPVDTEAKARLRWYLEDYAGFVGAGDRVLAREVEQKIEDWGRALFVALFDHAEGAGVHRRLMDAARGQYPAILTLVADEADVHVQPWEMVRDRRGPLVFQGVTIRRQLRGAWQARRRPWLSLPLRVLMITSRPNMAGFIDPRNSILPMLDALDALPRGKVTVDFCEPPTLGRLEEMISEARKRRHPFHIVHFDGHGSFRPKTGVGVLAFERDEHGRDIHAVTGRRFGELLSRLEIPLVILEACRSSALSEQPIFGSVAPALLQSGVGSVIAFSHSVHIEASKLLIGRFYAEFAGGMTVGRALEKARGRLRARPKRWLSLGPNAETVDLQDWFIPQLYQVGPDPALVEEGEHGAEPVIPRDRTEHLLGFPPEPMYRFHGRAQELLQLERAFRRVPAVALTAMGGMGKTALAREAAAWWLRTRRFEAALFHSFEQKTGAARVVQVLGQAIEGEDFSSLSAEDQWTLGVEAFRQRRILFVWDNFESTLPDFQKGHDSPLQYGRRERRRLQRLYHELTESQPAGRLLVTCRPGKVGLPGIQAIELSGLARPDSLHLLSAVLHLERISTDRDGYDREGIVDLLKALHDHPLSISLVAPHLEAWAPSQIREKLREGLERFANESAEEVRNRSLLASLAFSTRRLSKEARRVLPYLAWFEGGMYKDSLPIVTQLDAETSDKICDELVATALIHRIEKTRYLRFHPTLPYAARPEDVADAEDVEKSFIDFYVAMAAEVDKAFRSLQPAVGISLLSLDEANFRSALRRAFRNNDRQAIAYLAQTLTEYLMRTGRVRERDEFVAWVRSKLSDDVELDKTAWGAVLDRATGLLSEGKVDKSVAMVRGLIGRLEKEGLVGVADARFEVALSYGQLSEIYVNVNRPDLALEPAQRAISLLEQLSGDKAKGNLVAPLGDLANAYRALGRLDEASVTAERAMVIAQESGDLRSVAAVQGMIGEILSHQHRYADADIRFGAALGAARASGDLTLEGAALQHQAVLSVREGNPGQAVELFKRSLGLFEQAGNVGSQMRTCNSLGVAEKDLGHLDAAEAWFARSRELAQERNDRYQLAGIAQNIGSLHMARAEQVEDSEARGVHLQRAVESAEEGLGIWLEMGNQVNVASSFFLLGVLHLISGRLDRAEASLRQSVQIRESLRLPVVYTNYGMLAQVARAKGDAEAAAVWQAKCDAKLQ